MKMRRILLSNDDGIQAIGINVLARALQPLGEVWVVAPDRERSAVSHAISLHKPLRLRELGERRYAVDGTPTDAVYMAVNHLMPVPPDVVVSGINHGANLGNDVLYSGTVSAAMEGSLFGFSAVAISLCLPHGRAPASPLSEQSFEPAAAFCRDLVLGVLDRPMPPGVLLNVNVPDRPASELKAPKLCRLGYTDWADEVTERVDPRGKSYFWIGGERSGHDAIADSDNNAVAAGHIAVTPIHYDLTDYRSFAYVRALRVPGQAWCPDALGNDPLPHPVHPKARRAGDL